MSYTHGNWDFDHGCITTSNISYNCWNKSPIEKQQIEVQRKELNKGRTYRVKSHVPYCALFSRDYGGYGCYI